MSDDLKSLCEATLERHIDGFVKADLELIMRDYHPDATIQLPAKTIIGIEGIRDMFTGFFKVKPAGSVVNLQRKETMLSAGSCVSCMWYSMKSDNVDFPMATDTFFYNSSGQIIHQTFAGHNVHVSAEKPAATCEKRPIRIGWIGLGQMGKGHVSNLLEKGFTDIVVWNRTTATAEELVQRGAVIAASPKNVVEQCDVTFVMLSTPAIAREVYSRPDGIIAGLTAAGKGIIDCASLDADCMRELQNLVKGKGGRFVASPVAGHSGMARNATCQFICAGDQLLYEEVNDLFDAMAKNKVWLGEDVGAASNLKLIINGLLANITASMAEGVTVADKAGISREALKGIVSGHAMNSPLLQLCMKLMFSGQHDPLFMVQHMSKDATLCSQLAASVHQESKLIDATKLLYDAAVQCGLSEQNWTAVFESIKKTAV